jgi:hypothetical protein
VKSEDAGSSAEESLDEVQDYLQELFGRYGMSQPKAATPSPTATRRAETVTVAAPIPQAKREPPAPAQPPSMPEPKPPPERRQEILALRELASHSAHNAIADFDAKRLTTITWTKFWLCGGALSTTVLFARFVTPTSGLTLGAAGFALLLAIYWCGQFWMFTRRAALARAAGRATPPARPLQEPAAEMAAH